MELESAQETIKHPRKDACEDFCSANYFPESDVSLFLVCDGVSGKEGEKGSHFAANFLRDSIRNALLKNKRERDKPENVKLIEKIIDEEFKRTSERMLNEVKAATTLELALFEHKTQKLYTAHCGDSEMYLVRGNASDYPFSSAKIEPFTIPHVDMNTGGPSTRLGPGGYDRFDPKTFDIGAMNDEYVFLLMTTDWIRERNLRKFTLKMGFEAYKRGDDLKTILSPTTDFYYHPRELLLDKIKTWMAIDQFKYVMEELRKLGFSPDLERLGINENNALSDEELNKTLYQHRMRIFSQLLSPDTSNSEEWTTRLAIIYDIAEGKIYDDFTAVVVDIKGSRRKYYEKISEEVITLERQLRDGGSSLQRQKIEELRAEKDKLQQENIRVTKANADLAGELEGKVGYISPKEFERRKKIILKGVEEKDAETIIRNIELTEKLKTISRELIEARRTLTDYESQLRKLREEHQAPEPVIGISGLSDEQREKLEKLHVIEEENITYKRQIGNLETRLGAIRKEIEEAEKRAETSEQKLNEIRDKEAKDTGKVYITTETLDAAVAEAERRTDAAVREAEIRTEERVRKEYEKSVPEQILSKAVTRREAEVRRQYIGYVSRSVHDNELRSARASAEEEAEQRVRQQFEGYVAQDVYRSATVQLEAAQQGNLQLNEQLSYARQESDKLRTQLETEKEDASRLRTRLNSAVEDIVRLREDLTGSQTQLESMHQEYDTITSELTKKGTELADTQSQLESSRREYERTTADLSKKEGELSDTQTQLKSSRQEYERTTAGLSRREAELSDTKALLKLAESNVQGLETRVDELTRTIEEQRRITSASDDEKISLIGNYQAELSQARGEIDRYKQLGEEQKRRADETEAVLAREIEVRDRLERQVSSLTQQVDGFKEQIGEGIALVASNRRLITDYEAEVAGYKTQVTDLTRRLTDAERKAEELRREKEILDEKYSYYIPQELLPVWINDNLISFDIQAEANLGEDVTPEQQNVRLEQRREYIKGLFIQCISPEELDEEIEEVKKEIQKRLTEREQKVRAEYVDFLSPIEYNIELQRAREEEARKAEEKVRVEYEQFVPEQILSEAITRREAEVRKEYDGFVSPDAHREALVAKEGEVEQRYANRVPPETVHIREAELEEARQASTEYQSQLELAQSNIQGLEERLSAAERALESEKAVTLEVVSKLETEKGARTNAETELETKKAEITDTKRKLADEKSAREEERTARADLEQQLGTYESQNLTLARANVELTKRAETADGDLTAAQQTSEGYRTRAEAEKQRAEAVEANAMDYLKQNTRLSERVSQLEADNGKYKDEKDAALQRAAASESLAGRYESERDAALKRAEEAESSAKRTKGEADARIEAQRQAYELQITEFRGELARLREQSTKLSESYSGLERRLDNMADANSRLQEDNRALTGETLRLSDDNTKLIDDKKRLAGENKVLRREIEGYEAERERLAQEPIPEQLELDLTLSPVEERAIKEEEEKAKTDEGRKEEEKPETLDENSRSAIISNLRRMKVKFVSPSSVLYSSLNGEAVNNDTSVTYEGSNDGNHTFEVVGRVYKRDKKGKADTDKTELYRIKCSVRANGGNDNYEIDKNSLDVHAGTNNGSVMYNANALKENGITASPTNVSETNNCKISIQNNPEQPTQSIEGKLYAATTSRRFVIAGKKETKVDEDCGFFRVEYEKEIRLDKA